MTCIIKNMPNWCGVDICFFNNSWVRVFQNKGPSSVLLSLGDLKN
jgi:hypothetical protein